MHAIKRLRISALNFVSIYPSQGLVITKVFLAEKMSVSRECSLLFMSVILCGCLYGQCMDGPCSLERERMIKSIKAYGEFWTNPKVNKEKWRADWVACGGMSNGQYSGNAPSGSTTKIILDSQEDERQKLDFCMQSKGYEFIR